MIDVSGNKPGTHYMCVRYQRRFLRKPVRIFACACERTFPSKGKLVRHLQRFGR